MLFLFFALVNPLPRQLLQFALLLSSSKPARFSSSMMADDEIEEVKRKIEGVEREIEKVEQDIEAKERDIQAVVKQLKAAHSSDVASDFRNEKSLLWNEKSQLRDKENKLRDKENKLRDTENKLRDKENKLLDKENKLLDEKSALRKDKRLREEENQPEVFSHSRRSRIEGAAPPRFQSFAESAAEHYGRWEQAQKAGVENGGHKNFLVVSADPFGSYPTRFVVWIRKCYQDLKEILMKAKESERFVLLGTAGIGKSLFTLFWICYRAFLKEKVAWKLPGNKFYLLDFSKEGSSSVQMVSETNSELQVVLDDPNAWLIIGGGQSHDLTYACHILMACPINKKNYHQFMKHGMASRRYVPVWSEEEINQFLVDFEALRVIYADMDVPTKDQATEAFRKLGGVPRFILRAAKTNEGIRRAGEAVHLLGKPDCLMLFSGAFQEIEANDYLVHIKCSDGSYEAMFYDFASPYVQDEFGQRFTKLSKVDVVDFLRRYEHHF